MHHGTSVVGDSLALKLAAFGWTIASLAITWAIIERRGRHRAERARDERQRESDAERHERMRRLRDATEAMRAAVQDLTRDD